MDDIILEGIIYTHFPTEDDDFKNGVTSDYSMDKLRESCAKEINELIDKRMKEARVDELENIPGGLTMGETHEYIYERIEELNKGINNE